LLSENKNRCRYELVDWIIREANQRRILVGADFAFAYPYCDRSAYFPRHHNKSPESAAALWQAVDTICHDEPDFYGGPFYRTEDAPFSMYLLYQKYTGSEYDNNRHRLRTTEQVCKDMGTPPTCTFKCVGPDQVGSGSAAGMRVLHFLAKNHSGTISIWPFDSVSQSRSTLVEIFPRLFFAIAGRKPRKWKVNDTVNAVLKHFGSEPLIQDISKYSEDEIDAIVSAAALRELSSNPKFWHPQGLDMKTQRFEGWIFGCG